MLFILFSKKRKINYLMVPICFEAIRHVHCRGMCIEFTGLRVPAHLCSAPFIEDLHLLIINGGYVLRAKVGNAVSRSSTLRSESGKRTYSITAKRMISRLVLKDLNGECFGIRRGYETTLHGSSSFCLTVPHEALVSTNIRKAHL